MYKGIVRDVMGIIRTRANLVQLRDALNQFRKDGVEHLVDLSGLPTYGGKEPEGTDGIFSWDEFFYLTLREKWQIKKRKDANRGGFGFFNNGIEGCGFVALVSKVPLFQMYFLEKEFKTKEEAMAYAALVYEKACTWGFFHNHAAGEGYVSKIRPDDRLADHGYYSLEREFKTKAEAVAYKRLLENKVTHIVLYDAPRGDVWVTEENELSGNWRGSKHRGNILAEFKTYAEAVAFCKEFKGKLRRKEKKR